MFCSGCGHALQPGQPDCPQCGRPVASIIPPIPNLDFQLHDYAGKIRALSIVWFVYGGLALVLGFVGLTFANAFFNRGFGPWANAPWGGTGVPPWLGPAMHVAWVVIILRSALAFAAGWGLMDRTQWGRIVAIVAAFLSLIKFPIGTALGIWTLVTLLGYRNSKLYEQL